MQAGGRILRRHLSNALPALLLSLVVVAFWLERYVWAARPFDPNTYDLYNYYIPLYEVTFERMASGELPLWNPHHLAGIPWLASLQAGVCYPPHWLYVFLPTRIALALSNVFHLLLIALSAAAFTRKAGLAELATSAFALLFAFAGATLWYIGAPAMLEAAAWLPLGCLAVVGLARGEGAPAVCTLALAAALSLLAGFTQMTVFLLYAWGTLLIALLVVPGEARGRRLGAAAAFAAALVLGAMIAAVQLLPTLELVSQGTRQVEVLSAAIALWRGHGVEPFASLRGVILDERFSLGIAPLVLAPAALFARRHRALAVWALVLGLGVTALAFASSGGVSMEIYRALPGIGWFRVPRRLLVLSTFCIVLLAAIGLDRIAGGSNADRAQERLARWPALPGAIAAGLALLLALVLWSTDDRLEAALSLGLAALLWLCGRARPGRRATVYAALILALVVCEVASRSTHRGRLYSAETFLPYTADAPFYAQLAGLAGPERVTWLPLRSGRQLKLAARYGIHWLDDYEPLNLRRQSEYFTYFQNGGIRRGGLPGFFSGVIIGEHALPPQRFALLLEKMGRRRRLLDLAANRYFVARADVLRREREALRLFIRSAGLVKRSSPNERFLLYENPRALPRALVTYRVERAPDTEALLKILSRSDFDPMQRSYVEGDAGHGAANGALQGHAASIVREGPTHVEVEAQLEAPGWLILADAYYSGWTAWLGEVALPIVPANHLFRAVPLPAGAHRVRFEYRPMSLRLGGAVSGVGIGLWLALAFSGGRARRSRTDRSSLDAGARGGAT